MNLRDLPDMSAAYQEVQEKNDGNLANNAPPYDKVTRRDVITGRLGKDEMGGKRKKHDCAKKVNYKAEEFDVIPEMHTMLEDGTVTHYDITNGEYIYENVPVEELEILISEKHEHFDNYDKNAEMLEGKYSGSKSHIQRDGTAPAPERTAAERKKDRRILAGYGKGGMEMAVDRAKKERDERRAARAQKEAFAFSEIELEELALLEEIDAMTDEQLIDMMEDLIIETAEDIDDLIEICEHLEEVEMLSEDYYDSAVKASKAASKTPEVRAANRRARVERLKSAAKSAGSKLKSAAKAVGGAAKKAGKAAVGAAGRAAGHAVGEYQAQRIKSKRAAMSRPEKKKEAPKSSSSDDDGTGGKLDALLAKTRGTSSSSSSDSDSGSSSSGGGGSSSSSSSSSSKSGETRKAVGGALRKVGSLVKRGLKKAVGKTARVVSSGSDKLAKRLGEEYEHIAHLYESGLFSMEEIENVIEERYKGKHGQTDKQYADSRSQGGKMVSGDSKMSGAEYTHGRRVKAANPGMQPDVGGKTKPKSQGKMDKGTRADLEYRKANLKKEEIEMEEGYKEIDRDKENKMYRRAGNLARTSLSAKGKAKQIAQDKSAKIVSAITRQKENERFKKMGDEKARDNYGG
ncbi:hypothetical protein [Synechococcus phage S-RS29]|nr:hypothetical protein [Synechococcus phage S-RS29]